MCRCRDLISRGQSGFDARRMTMLNKIALVFALAAALAGALPAFVGTALAQATVPQGECTTNYYGHGSCWGLDSNPSLPHFIPHAAKSGLVGAGFKPAPTPGVREISFLSPLA